MATSTRTARWRVPAFANEKLHDSEAFSGLVHDAPAPSEAASAATRSAATGEGRGRVRLVIG
jgi:hypothetical protein